MPITLVKSFVKSIFNRLGYEVVIKSLTKLPQKHKIKEPLKVEFIGPPGVGKTTGLASRTIERNIAELKKHGFLHRTGGRKEGFWVLTDEE